jgi:hypothetical protein
MLAEKIQIADRIDPCLRNVWEFVPDPDGIEYVAAPELQIRRAVDRASVSGAPFALWGDCDEAATLASSLLCSMGYTAHIVAIRRAGVPEFSHVFCRWDGGDIDPTVPDRLLPISGYEEEMVVEV